MTSAMLIIDMQNSFVKPEGSLSVPGAEGDAKRAAAFIRKNAHIINHITATLDSHHPIHIASQIYWKDEKGHHPKPFTVISLQDIKDGKWQAQFTPKWAKFYIETLEKMGKALTIWPPHCILGTEGWALHKEISDALVEWEEKTSQPYSLEYKGSNRITEHYSIFKAEVEVPGCPGTQLNCKLINKLGKFNRVFFLGEAANVCCLNSLADIIKYAPKLVSKLVFLEDCMSPIGQFDINTNPVYQKAVSMGAKVMKSTDVVFYQRKRHIVHI